MKTFVAEWFDDKSEVSFEDEVWEEHKKYRNRLKRRMLAVSDMRTIANSIAVDLAMLVHVSKSSRKDFIPELFELPLSFNLLKWQRVADHTKFIADREVLYYLRTNDNISVSQNAQNFRETYWTEAQLYRIPPPEIPIPQKCGPTLRTMGIDDDGNIRYWERWEDVGDVKRWRRMSVGKFLKRIRHKYKMKFSDEFIDVVAERVGGMHGDDEYNIEILSSQDIPRIYREAHFGSCMHHSDAVEAYDGQPNVRIMTLRDYRGVLCGRALVWNTEEGKTVLDRVYPSDDGAQIDAAMDYARSNGWTYKVQHSIGGRLNDYPQEHSVRFLETALWPYMDTFMGTDGPDGSGHVILRNFSNTTNYELTDTSGEAPWGRSASMYCEYTNEYWDEEDMTWVESVQTYVSERGLELYFVVDLIGYYIEESNAQRIDNTGEYFDYRSPPCGIVYNEYTDQYYDTDYSDVAPATAGRCEGEFFYTNELVEINGEYYWEGDPEFPEEESDEEE